MICQQKDWVAFVRSQGIDFNVSMCWHVPKGLKRNEINKLVSGDKTGWHQNWLEYRMRYYFNQLDRKLLKSAHRNKQIRVWRFITHEWSDSVGWHVHGLLATPPGIDQTELVNRASWLWLRSLRHYEKNSFAPYLVQAGPTTGDYLGYITKSLSHPCYDKAGIVDLTNTAFPKT